MSTSIVKTNVLIIGAGPSGATTSLFLTKMKIAHTIVDAAVFPRDKTCGDALDLKVLRVLHQLDPSIVNEEIMNDDNFAKAKGYSIILSKNKNCHFKVNDKAINKDNYPFFIVSKRSYFDNFLVQKIDNVYANFLQGTSVKKIEKEGSDWKVFTTGINELEIQAKLIIGADGDHSAVLRFLGQRKIKRSNYAAGLRQYWKGVSNTNNEYNLEFYLPKSLPLSYLWIFGLPKGEANVGFGMTSEMIVKKSINIKDAFAKLLQEDKALAHRFKNATPLEKPMGWGLPLASQKRKACGDGYLLVGDAASLICPTTGEGIGPGMLSGFIAAQYIQRAVQQNAYTKDMFSTYEREIYKRLEGDITKYNLIRKISPSLYSYLINIFSATGFAQYYFGKMVKKWINTAKEKTIEVNM